MPSTLCGKRGSTPFADAPHRPDCATSFGGRRDGGSPVSGATLQPLVRLWPGHRSTLSTGVRGLDSGRNPCRCPIPSATSRLTLLDATVRPLPFRSARRRPCPVRAPSVPRAAQHRVPTISRATTVVRSRPSQRRGRLRGRHHRGEADLPAQQSQASQAPRVSAPDVHTGGPGGSESTPAQGPAPSVGLTLCARPLPQMTVSPWHWAGCATSAPFGRCGGRLPEDGPDPWR